MRESGETILYSPSAPVLLVSLVLFMLNWPFCDLLPKICTLPQPKVPAATPPRHRQGQRWKAQSCVILETNTFQKSSNPNIYIQNSSLYTIPDMSCGQLPEYKSASDKNAKNDQSVSAASFDLRLFDSFWTFPDDSVLAGESYRDGAQLPCMKK